MASDYLQWNILTITVIIIFALADSFSSYRKIYEKPIIIIKLLDQQGIRDREIKLYIKYLTASDYNGEIGMFKFVSYSHSLGQ